MDYTISLSNAENLALSYVALSQQEWIDNAVHERCRVAIEEIVRICVDRCLASNIQIPGSRDAIVELAFNQGWVKSAVEVQQELANSQQGQV